MNEKITSTESTENDNTHTIKVKKNTSKKAYKIQPMKITDFDMPFGSMVSFMIKWVLASIPAMIILFIIGLIMSMIFISIFGTIMMTSFSQFG